MVATKESPLFDPSNCSYKLSATIRAHVQQLIEAKDTEPATKSVLVDLMDEEESNKSTITYESLVKLHKFIQRADCDYNDPFYMFMESCKCIKPQPRKNQELDERLKRLRLKYSHLVYNELTATVDRKSEEKVENAKNSSSNLYSNLNNSDDSESTLSEFRKLYGSAIAVLNSFLVFVCTFIFCYKALEYALWKPNIIAQVVFGLTGSIIVAIAELYFLLRVV